MNNDISEGDIIVEIHGDDIIGKLIAEGATITHPDFPYGEIPSHVTSPIFTIDYNFMNTVVQKFENTDPNYPNSREWVKSHLIGKPVAGDLGICEMVANGINGGSLKDSGYLTATNIFVLEPVTPWTDMGKKELSIMSAFYFKKQIPYDYFVYLAYAVKIGSGCALKELLDLSVNSGPWLGPNSNNTGLFDPTQWKQVCVELGERLTNWMVESELAINAMFNNGKIPFSGNLNEAQPIDILLHPFYRIKATSPNQLNYKQ
jgi:hypothetical protein